jgi:hypothetical protein
MSEQHTPGRLHAFTTYADHELRDEAGNFVAVVHRYGIPGNARRLAACWNACEGLSTESLERSDVLSAMNQRHLMVSIQRDDVLAALKAVLQWVDDNCETTGFEMVEAQADAAIAKVEGDKS